jgi:Chondroitinase B
VGTINNEYNKIILKDKKFTDQRIEIEDCTNCKIIGCDFSYDGEDEVMLILNNCVGCVVSDCEFHDKVKKGLFIKIVGEKSKDNVIERCVFRDHTFPDDNGGESICIGNSACSSCEFNTTIRYCHFRNLKGDPETVSIKSCGNILENNIHEKCESNFTIRHGGFNTIRDNMFIGCGGIRVFGDGNAITGNYHQNNHNSDFPPLALCKGSVDTDPSFSSDGKPSGKKHDDTHDEYVAAKNNLIEGNTYENCEGTCVVWGKKNKPEHTRIPKWNKFRKNTLIADDNDSRLLKFDETEVADNEFEDNQLYGENAKSGDIPEEAIKKLSTRPEIKIPDAGPKATKVVAAPAAPS